MVLLDSSSVATDEMCCCGDTGACCIDGMCSITTEEDCTGMGGTYLGNGTTCDPNPCACSCNFLGFLGIGHYLHASTSTTGVTNAASGAVNSSWSATSSTAIDPDTCEVSCLSFSGSGDCSDTRLGFECSGTVTAIDCHATTCLCFGNCSFSLVQVSSVPYGTGAYMEWSESASGTCTAFCSGCYDGSSGSVTVISDTVMEIHWILVNPSFGYDATQTITLSDPCIPV